MKFLKKEWFLLLILIIQLIAAIIIYPYMPDQVPTHWNMRGEIDDYSSKEFGTFFLPLMNIGLYVLFLALPHLDPKKANYDKFHGSYRLIRFATHIFFTFMFFITAAVSLGYSVDVGLWISVGVALLFIVMGNIMGRVRHNYFVGFRYPWTLANEEVWRKTHRFGSKAMVIGGVLALVGVVLTQDTARFIVLMVGLFIPTIITTVYSYLVFKNIEKS
ncbi:MAG: SdpI family protein [Clostridia bacterium]|nr:SdpI family protein [Clostridia bacterium]